MDQNITKIRFYLGDKQDDINLICQFLENIGFTYGGKKWKDWMSSYPSSSGCFVDIRPLNKNFCLDNSGREYCNKYSVYYNISSTMLIDLLQGIPSTNPGSPPPNSSIPGTYPGPYCSCIHPNFIKNTAAGETFDVCTICKKEKS